MNGQRHASAALLLLEEVSNLRIICWMHLPGFEPKFPDGPTHNVEAKVTL